jgi:nicotinamidase-related amidase
MSQATKIPTPPVQGQATALLVIDVQQGLFRKSTPIYRAEPLLNTLTTLIERCRAAGVPVIYIQHASDKVLPFGSADWQLHPRLRPSEKDLIVHKQHSNAFEGTPLHILLVERGVGNVIVTGLVTHGCVKATCLGALALGYAVTLAEDGHSSYSKDAAQLIQEWNHKLGEAGVMVAPASQIAFGGPA